MVWYFLSNVLACAALCGIHTLPVQSAVHDVLCSSCFYRVPAIVELKTALTPTASVCGCEILVTGLSVLTDCIMYFTAGRRQIGHYFEKLLITNTIQSTPDKSEISQLPFKMSHPYASHFFLYLLENISSFVHMNAYSIKSDMMLGILGGAPRRR